MKLAILVTNTDLSEFAYRHPFDGEKFTTMVHSVRPDWACVVFNVHQNEFPASLDPFDGIIITGSPASVHDGDLWALQLQELIRMAIAGEVPIFGACYGHQAIAVALGGEVGDNPDGWCFGLAQCEITAAPPWMEDLGTQHAQFAAHKEQVTRLPQNARTISRAKGVPCAGFVIGNRVFTSQNHPEMTAPFFKALLDEYRDLLGPDVAGDADKSLAAEDDNRAYAQAIAAFFEQAIR